MYCQRELMNLYPRAHENIEKGLAALLLHADGSTTRLLEAMIGGNISLKIHRQGTVPLDQLSAGASSYFGDQGPFLQRIISLHYQDDVLSDNLVLASLRTMDPKLQAGLLEGKIPLGKLIDDMETKRVIIYGDYESADMLQSDIHPIRLTNDIYPVKKYLILHNRTCLFYICEVFHSQNIVKHFLNK